MDGDQGTDTGSALDALRRDWGEAYETETDGTPWRARRRDGNGGWLEARSPGDLRSQITADYLARPVGAEGATL